jgi:hypothetical protein
MLRFSMMPSPVSRVLTLMFRILQEADSSLFRHDQRHIPTGVRLINDAAIPLPKLFIDLSPGLACGMGSGFVINRLLDGEMAVIEDGRFKILSPADS